VSLLLSGEQRTWLERPEGELGAVPSELAPAFCARVLRGGGGIDFGLTEFAAGRAMDQECLAICRRLGGHQRRGLCKLALGREVLLKLATQNAPCSPVFRGVRGRRAAPI